MKAYDVAFSLGDGLRPGSIYDANDDAQLGELKTLGRAHPDCLEARCAGDDRRPRPCADATDQREWTKNWNGATKRRSTPASPLTTDIAPGYDHITSAIGAAQLAGMAAPCSAM